MNRRCQSLAAGLCALSIVTLLAAGLAGCKPAGTSDDERAGASRSAEDGSSRERLAEVERTYTPQAANAKPMHSAAHVSARVEGVPTNAIPGKEYELTLVLEVAEGWHINANPVTFDFLIPTKLTLNKTSALRLASVSYPKGKSYQFAGLEKPLVVYEKTVRIPFRVAVARGATPGSLAATGQVSVQECDDKTCLAPSQIPVRFALEISRS